MARDHLGPTLVTNHSVEYKLIFRGKYPQIPQGGIKTNRYKTSRKCNAKREK